MSYLNKSEALKIISRCPFSPRRESVIELAPSHVLCLGEEAFHQLIWSTSQIRRDIYLAPIRFLAIKQFSVQAASGRFVCYMQ